MRSIGRGGLAALATLAVVLCVPAVAGADGVGLELVGTVNDPNVNDLTGVTADPSNRDRIFVLDRTSGVIHQIAGGSTSPFLDLKPGFTPPDDSSFEKGVLSMAFAPDYATSHLFYVSYATGGAGTDGGVTKLVEYRTDERGAAIPSSRRDILTIDHHSWNQHYGGQLQFGPDGYLYMSTGEAYVNTNAQSLASLSGKILRINPRESGANPYTVPADNPFVGVGGAAAEIWSLGFRNPWRFSFDKLTGDIIIGDVGDSKREEIDFASLASGLGRGANYGWPCREGSVAGDPDYFAGVPNCSAPTTFTEPSLDYSHAVSPIPYYAVIGGYVSRDPGVPDLLGRYVYADLGAERMRSVSLSDSGATGDRFEMTLPDSPESFGEDSCGRLYVAIHRDGDPVAPPAVYRIVGPAPTDCNAVTFPDVPVPPDGLAPQRKTGVVLKRLGRRGPVRRGSHVRLRARVKPCAGRTGDLVLLKRKGKTVARKRIRGGCSADFRVRAGKGGVYQATVPGTADYLKGVSKTLKVALQRTG